MRRDAGTPDFSELRGRHVLIALSGGADSVALAAMLAEARPALALRLSAAHLDHGIRPDSADDAEFCRTLCLALDIPFYTKRIDVPALAARTGRGLETTARNVRYGWLRLLRGQLGADRIALAHHMDDQAETVLMHLCRGAGPDGAGGMAACRGDLVRPLLGLRKRELVDYLRARGLAWREDATNAVDDTPRNALRLHAIPELEKSYPQAVPALARYAEAERIESDYVALQARAWLRGHLLTGPYGRCLSLAELPHPALLRRAIRAICGPSLDHERLLAVEALAWEARGATQISGALFAERGRRGIYFLRQRRLPMREAPFLNPGVSRLPGICALRARPAAPAPLRGDPLTQALDAGALEGAVLRTRRDGDRFRPLGCGDRLLSDFMTDRKLDRPLRDCVALVARGDRVLWVCGMGISADAAIRPDTAAAVALECRYDFALPL